MEAILKTGMLASSRNPQESVQRAAKLTGAPFLHHCPLMKVLVRSLAVVVVVLSASSAYAIPNLGNTNPQNATMSVSHVGAAVTIQPPSPPSEVPESGSLILLSAGAFAAAGLIRRRK
jgi:hypothetical protein